MAGDQIEILQRELTILRQDYAQTAQEVEVLRRYYVQTASETHELRTQARTLLTAVKQIQNLAADFLREE